MYTYNQLELEVEGGSEKEYCLNVHYDRVDGVFDGLEGEAFRI